LLCSLAIAFLPQVLCGPAGVGKTALGRTLCERFPTEFGLAVRHTDRYSPAEPASSVACGTAAALVARRIHRRALPGEIAGVDFHFVLPAEYDLWLSRGEFAVSAAAAQWLAAAVAAAADAPMLCLTGFSSRRCLPRS
jgi:ribose 1,5-bisphosphokinase PhnN